MVYKFEKFKVWTLSLELLDLIYELSNDLPDSEKYNLKSQLIRAGTSISLNIAEGSTSQTDAQQKQFIIYAIRSLTEVIACLRIIDRRNYCLESVTLFETNKICSQLFKRLQAFNKSLK